MLTFGFGMHIHTHAHVSNTHRYAAGRRIRRQIRGQYRGTHYQSRLWVCKSTVLSMGSRSQGRRKQELHSEAFALVFHVHCPNFPSLANEPLPEDQLFSKRTSFLTFSFSRQTAEWGNYEKT